MKNWTDKTVFDLTIDDKIEMIEAFSNSLGEFHLASANNDKNAVELISKTLIETFAIVIMGDDAIRIENTLKEFENNISNHLDAKA
jgi:hypothetical protein|tara:strand:+ start:363 stop:620 length:258 start_codon:yes stop_codon:yes gene_type:complete